jgi:hypothetical protein
VRGISRITSSGVFSSLISLMRTFAAILQIERDPPTASELSKLKYQKLLAAMMIIAAL